MNAPAFGTLLHLGMERASEPLPEDRDAELDTPPILITNAGELYGGFVPLAYAEARDHCAPTSSLPHEYLPYPDLC